MPWLCSIFECPTVWSKFELLCDSQLPQTCWMNDDRQHANQDMMNGAAEETKETKPWLTVQAPEVYFGFWCASLVPKEMWGFSCQAIVRPGGPRKTSDSNDTVDDGPILHQLIDSLSHYWCRWCRFQPSTVALWQSHVVIHPIPVHIKSSPVQRRFGATKAFDLAIFNGWCCDSLFDSTESQDMAVSGLQDVIFCLDNSRQHGCLKPGQFLDN